MTSVQDLWRVQNFQSAVINLLRIAPDRIDALSTDRLLLDGYPDDPEDDRSFVSAVGALRTLYRIAQSEDATQVVADVHEKIQKRKDAQEFRQGLALLPQLLARRPGVERTEYYRRVRGNQSPQVLALGASLEFVATKAPRDFPSQMDLGELVPTIKLTLELDENIQGGEIVRVGISPELIAELEDEIRKLRALYEQLTVVIPPGVIPKEGQLDWAGGEG